MLMLLLVTLLVAGMVAALASTPFRPAASVAPLRLLVTVMASASGVMLAVSLTRDWWVAMNWEGAVPQTAGGEHVVVRSVVATGLLSCALTLAATWGRRNWAPLGLIGAWLAVGIAWYESSGEVTGTPTEASSGLRLAMWAMVLVTAAATLSSLGRLAERRAAARTRSAGAVDPPPGRAWRRST